MFVLVGKCCDGMNSIYCIVYGCFSDICGLYLDKNGIDMLVSGGSIFDVGNS